jgi:hypothetical protein
MEERALIRLITSKVIYNKALSIALTTEEAW